MSFVKFRKQNVVLTKEELLKKYYEINKQIRKHFDANPPRKIIAKVGDNPKALQNLKRKRAIVLTLLNQRGIDSV